MKTKCTKCTNVTCLRRIHAAWHARVRAQIYMHAYIASMAADMAADVAAGMARNGTARHRAQHSTARRFIPTGEAEKMELESGESGDLEACRALRAHCARARACRRTYLNLQQCQLMRSSHESAHAMKSHLAC